MVQLLNVDTETKNSEPLVYGLHWDFCKVVLWVRLRFYDFDHVDKSESKTFWL